MPPRARPADTTDARRLPTPLERNVNPSHARPCGGTLPARTRPLTAWMLCSSCSPTRQSCERGQQRRTASLLAPAASSAKRPGTGSRSAAATEPAHSETCATTHIRPPGGPAGPLTIRCWFHEHPAAPRESAQGPGDRCLDRHPPVSPPLLLLSRSEHVVAVLEGRLDHARSCSGAADSSRLLQLDRCNRLAGAVTTAAFGARGVAGRVEAADCVCKSSADSPSPARRREAVRAG
jgi:hypothetical protein